MQKKIKKNAKNAAPVFPGAADFRFWLADALPLVGLSAAAVGRDLGLGKNTLGDFLAKPRRDICLGNAARVHDLLTRRAGAAGVDLPVFGGRV
jgi:hypothetical protein